MHLSSTCQSTSVIHNTRALQVLEGMRGELASTVQAGSARTLGERTWLLPERLHPLDEAIAAVRFHASPFECCQHVVWVRCFLYMQLSVC